MDIRKKVNILLLLVCFALYFFNKANKYHEVDESIVKYVWDYNFTDYLCQIIFLATCNLYLQLLKVKQIYRFDLVVGWAIVCAVAWEICAKLVKSTSTIDLLDIAAYLLGAVTYWLVFWHAGRQVENNADMSIQ